MNRPWSSLALFAILVAAGCDGGTDPADGGDPVDAAAARDAGPGTPDAGTEDAGDVPMDGGAPDAGSMDAGSIDAGLMDAGAPPVVTLIELPLDGAEVIHSIAARVQAPPLAVRVDVSVVGSPGLECSSDVRNFECLLDVSMLAPGPFMLRAISYDAGDAEVGRDEIALTRRAVDDPCAGVSGDNIDCVLERATAGTAAGFTGVTYLNYDDRHANANTTRMTGIDARVLAAVPRVPPSDAVLGIGNESRACNVSGGWLSRPRCDSVSKGIGHYEANFLMFWPEHRDHGIRDYYQWQGPFYDLSQGSSGTELDEVVKMLTALGMMSPTARSALSAANAVAPTLAMLLRRSRLASDAEYLTPEAHVTALGNASNGDSLMALAAALRMGELPPIARLARSAETFPAAWMMSFALSSEYALGLAPRSLLPGTPSGTFEVDVDLSASTDIAGRPLVFFPALLRGDPADVTITRLNPAGTLWRVAGSFPADRTVLTGGEMRTVSRITVGFFAHNGMWMGPPAMLSIGGRPGSEPAPGSNNLD